MSYFVCCMLKIKSKNSKHACLFSSRSKIKPKTSIYLHLLYQTNNQNIKCISTFYLTILFKQIHTQACTKSHNTNQSNESASNQIFQIYKQRICSHIYACASNSVRRKGACMVLRQRFSLHCSKLYKYASLSLLALFPGEVEPYVFCSLCNHSNYLLESVHEVLS
jgi:hypothetical protein